MRLFLLTFWVFTTLRLEAATYIAASPARADVEYAITNAPAVDGDTIEVPAGTAYWTSRLLITNKLLTLKGAGWDDTIVVDENPVRSTFGTVLGVVITSKTNGGFFRITGIQFRGGTTNTTGGFNGGIYISASNNLNGTNSNWRIDHCKFTPMWNRQILAAAWTGLIDHNYFDLANGQYGVLLTPQNLGTYGDASWATSVPIGTWNEGIYLEDNISTASSIVAIVDGWAGARFVFRHNISTNGEAGGHGTESSGIYRSFRWKAVYNNEFIGTTSGEYATLWRGGSGVAFSNNVSGTPGFGGLGRMTYYRDSTSFTPWGGAYGSNGWDTNDSNVYYSGYLTADTAAPSLVLTDTNASWTVNQWVDHSIHSTNRDIGGLITANTATTITILTPFQTQYIYSWTNGEPYQIKKLIRGIDQPGNGEGDLITYTDTPVWPNQIIEPIYFWDNTGKTNLSNAGYYNVVANRDYYSGVAHPSYTPFTYPHPLIAMIDGDGPTITDQPDSQSIGYGEQATLSVLASGAGTLNYQWYWGSSGDTSTPISGETSSSITTGALFETVAVHVVVTDDNGSTDSETATITVGAAPQPSPVMVNPNYLRLFLR